MLRAVANLLAYSKLRALILEPLLFGLYARLASGFRLSCDPIDQMPRCHCEIEDPIHLVLTVLWPAVEGALQLSVEGFCAVDCLL